MHLATLARNQGGGQTGQSKPPTKFLCIVSDFQKKIYVDLFRVKPMNNISTTCILNRGPCFCMVQCIRDSSFVERSLYSLRAKHGYSDIRERIDQPPFP